MSINYGLRRVIRLSVRLTDVLTAESSASDFWPKILNTRLRITSFVCKSNSIYIQQPPFAHSLMDSSSLIHIWPNIGWSLQTKDGTKFHKEKKMPVARVKKRFLEVNCK